MFLFGFALHFALILPGVLVIATAYAMVLRGNSFNRKHDSGAHTESVATEMLTKQQHL